MHLSLSPFLSLYIYISGMVGLWAACDRFYNHNAWQTFGPCNGLYHICETPQWTYIKTNTNM